MVFYEYEMDANLLNVDKATTLDFPLATNDTSTHIPIDRLQNKKVHEATLDDVGEVYPNGDVLDQPEYANDDQE